MATTAQQLNTGTGRKPEKRKLTWTPYLFILPHLIFFAMFVGYPFFNGLWISLHQYDFARPEATRFIGLENYANLFIPSATNFRFNEFWNALINTFEFVVLSVPPLVLLPLGLAVLLNTKTPGRNIFRGIYFAPWVLSAAVVGLIWWWIFQSSGGLINFYLSNLGIKPPNWLSTMPWAWVAIVVATVWWIVGFNMIILLAALQDIPEHLYEAASIDGATGAQAFFRVTLPMLRPVMIFVVTITVISSFNLFAQPLFMTRGGGPPEPGGVGGSTEPIMLRIFNEGFGLRTFQGSAAAMSFVVAIIMVVVSLINARVLQERE